MRLVELRLVGALRFDVPDHALQPTVNDERRPAARADDFVFRLESRHHGLLHELWQEVARLADYDTGMSRRSIDWRSVPERGRV